MKALAARRGRTVATVATLTVGLLLAAWLLRGALPEAKAEPTYERTVTMTCSTTVDTPFWPVWNASAVATIAGEPDGSEHIVGVGNFQAWLIQRPWGQPVSWFWITDVYATDQAAIDHELGESGGKLADWFVGGKMNAIDQVMPVNCSGRFELP
jgi:hypothetical protein